MSRCDWTESFKRLNHSETNQLDSKQWVVVIEPNHLNDWFIQERIRETQNSESLWLNQII